MPTAEEFIDAARQSAIAWNLRPEEISIISHSENVVCDLALPGGEHLIMRLHRPGYNTLDELNSEVQWVSALGASGLPVPSAVPTMHGEYYRPVLVGGETRYVGVVEWVDGTPLGGPLSPGDGNVAAQYGQIGQLAARIRAHNASWSPSAGFTRRRWDADGLVGPDPLWGRFWQAPALTSEQKALFTAARSELHTRLSALSTAPERFGMIHADLHLGNLMVEGDALTVIDFDDAGSGWFAYELAIALHPMLEEDSFPEARRALLDGYRSEHDFSEDEEATMDMLLVVRSLIIVGWLSNRPELPVYQYLPDLIGQAERMTRELLGEG